MTEFDLQQSVTMACLLDVIAPKPGNVHRGADFADATFLDFAASAVAIGPVMERASDQPLGETILAAVQATRRVTDTNTNLGIILLIAPLAAVIDSPDPQQELVQRLQRTTAHDVQQTYQAIRLASAGGLGKAEQGDVYADDKLPGNLLNAMEPARERDKIAELYVTGFAELFEIVVPELVQQCGTFGIVNGLIATHVSFLVRQPDSLIARKCGVEVAKEASQRAARITGKTGSEQWQAELSDLDFWLRSDGNRRNPGTTADILTAAMFLGLYAGSINPVEFGI